MVLELLACIVSNDHPFTECWNHPESFPIFRLKRSCLLCILTNDLPRTKMSWKLALFEHPWKLSNIWWKMLLWPYFAWKLDDEVLQILVGILSNDHLCTIINFVWMAFTLSNIFWLTWTFYEVVAQLHTSYL